ncbi:unnamed protein product, partial [Polarella glacialis]
ELGPAELSAVAWSLASARHMGPPWSAALADALIRRSGSLPLRGLASLVWAWTVTEGCPQLMVDSALPAARSHLARLTRGGPSD